MRKLISSLISFLLISIAVASQAQTDDYRTLFKLAGSNTIGGSLAPDLVRDFLKQEGYQQIQAISLGENETEILALDSATRDRVKVAISAHGSSTGFQALANDQADIAMASRPIKSQEVDQLKHLGDLTGVDSEHVLAIDGIAIIVHPTNPISQLSREQIKAIFTGEISSWTGVGGQSLPISVFARDDNSGTWDSFKSLVLSGKQLRKNNVERFESNRDLAQAVARTPGAIGFVGLASVGQAKAVPVGDIGVLPLLPTAVSVATEDYLLSRRLYLYSAEQPVNPMAAQFLHYSLSDRAQALVAVDGFVSQVPALVKPEHLAGPQEYQALVKDAERLTLNIRFTGGSAKLDNKAQQDIQRLIGFLEQPELKQRKLLLVGFSDSKQTPERALVLSNMRALRVKSALRDHGISVEPVAGFGDYNPVADDNGELGKNRNQRVEVWLL